MTIVLLISSAKFCCSAPDTLVTGFISPNDAYNGLRTRSCLSNWICLERSLAQTSRTSRLPSFLPPPPTTVLQRRPAICSRRCTTTILPHEQPFPSTSLFTSDLSYGNTPYSLIDTPNRFLLRTSLDRDNCRVNIYFCSLFNIGKFGRSYVSAINSKYESAY